MRRQRFSSYPGQIKRGASASRTIRRRDSPCSRRLALNFLRRCGKFPRCPWNSLTTRRAWLAANRAPRCASTKGVAWQPVEIDPPLGPIFQITQLPQLTPTPRLPAAINPDPGSTVPDPTLDAPSSVAAEASSGRRS
jgi:hypothetical protein